MLLVKRPLRDVQRQKGGAMYIMYVSTESLLCRSDFFSHTLCILKSVFNIEYLRFSRTEQLTNKWMKWFISGLSFSN